jgi:hypothetical protein
MLAPRTRRTGGFAAGSGVSSTGTRFSGGYVFALAVTLMAAAVRTKNNFIILRDLVLIVLTIGLPLLRVRLLGLPGTL